VTLLAAAVLPSAAVAQHPPIDEGERTQPQIEEGVDYRVYDRRGNRVSLPAIVSAALGEDVLIVGEEHDDMIGHAFETALLDEVLEEVGGPTRSGRTVVLSLEMFERDVQYVLDEYLEGLISEDHFLRSSRPWDDYDIRYRPLVESARLAGAPVVAANAPRRYVNRVSSEGPFALETLSDHALSYLPPLPYPGPSDVYRAQWDALMEEAMAGLGETDEPEVEGGDDPEEAPAAEAEEEDEGARPYAVNPNVIQAQALWDASMGHSITEALVRHVGGFVVHFAGSFHVEKDTGIPERIADYRPGTRVISVVMTKVDDIDAWSEEEHAPLADYVVLTLKPSSDPPGNN
jgi:uncharacterized iron-regulated protein